MISTKKIKIGQLDATIQTQLNAKENTSNKTSTISGNEASTTLFSTIKGFIDWLKDGLGTQIPAKATALVDTDRLLLFSSGLTLTRTWAQIKTTLANTFSLIDSTFPMRLQSSASVLVSNTTYFSAGSNNLQLSTTNNRFVYAGITASSFRVSLFIYNNGTLGSNVDSVVTLLNNTQGTSITITSNAKTNALSYGIVENFNFAVTEGDELSLRIVTPTFSAAPSGVIVGANLILKR